MKYYLIIILGLIANSCQLELSNRRLMRDINNHSEVYTDLVSKISNSAGIKDNSTLIKFNDLPIEIVYAFNKTKLKNSVNYISIDTLACEDLSIEIIYLGKKHLVYSACPDSSFPKPNTYVKVGFIETWGINENWFIWKDNDPI